MARRRRRRRRVNKMVVLTGSLAVALLALVAVIVASYHDRDPGRYTADADAAMAVKDYESAALNYRRALGATKTKSEKVALLFKLAQAYVHTDQWPKVMACWNQVVVQEPHNIKALLALLEAYYIQADSQTRAGWQVGQIWKKVAQGADTLMPLVQQAGAMGQSKQTWEALENKDQTEREASSIPLGHYLYLVRGRAAYEQGRLGAVTDPNQAYARAYSDLQEVLRLDNTQVDAYWYLAQVLTERGEIDHARGDTSARQKAAQEADAVLARAVENAPQDAQAHTYLLEARLDRVRSHVADPAERRRQLKLLEKPYLELTETFAKRPEVFNSLARFYWMEAFFAEAHQRRTKIRQAIEMAQQAADLAPERVALWLSLGELYFRQAFMFQEPETLERAVLAGQRALASPEAQDTSGPRTFANKANRLSIHAFLAHCRLERILFDPEVPPEPMLIQQAQESVEQIEQLLGSPDDPEVAKWRGMLALAQGQSVRAVQELYSVYEKTKASHTYGRSDPVVSYALARVCLASPELGKALEFLSESLKSGMGYIRPQVVLDYLDLLGRLDMWTHVISKANAYSVDAYEAYFGPDRGSRSLRIRALIGTQRWQEAETHLARLDSSKADTLVLRLALSQARFGKAQTSLLQHQLGEEPPLSSPLNDELQRLQQEHVKWLRQLADAYPDKLEATSVGIALQSLMTTGQISTARDLISHTGTLAEKNASVGFYRLLLQEPDPGAVSAERRLQLHEQAFNALHDPVQQAVERGRFYQDRNQPKHALSQFLRGLDQSVTPTAIQSRSQRARDRRARLYTGASMALEIALERQDGSTVEKIIRRTRTDDIDGCKGKLFEARVAQSRERYEEALEKVNACLSIRPLFSRAYLLRSQIRSALDQEEQALQDSTQAATLNPLDPYIAKVHVQHLLTRNRKLADQTSEAQAEEALQAMERALRLDPTDPDLLGLYAQHTVDENPGKAVAIYQALVERYPTLDNALTLGDLATHVAGSETDEQRRQVYYKIAGSAYNKASTLDPHAPRLLKSYARYYRLTGQEDKAAALLSQGQDDRLLWQHFLRQGQIDKARQVLEQAHTKHPNDEQTLRGLLTVAQHQNRVEDVTRYAQSLVEAADTLTNRIEQITALLRLGLVQEADDKLRQARERFPQESRIILLEGWVSLRLGRLDQALARINQSLDTQRDSAVPWYLRGQVYLLQGKAQAAVDDLRRSKVLDDNPTTRLTLAKALLQAHRRAEAIVELKQAVTEKQAPRQVRQLLEQLYRDTGQTGELAAFYQQMQRRFPEEVTWLNRAGALHLQQQRPEKALVFYRQSSERKRKEYEGVPNERWRDDIEYANAVHGYFQSLRVLAGRGSTTDRSQKLTDIQTQALVYRGTPYEAMTRIYETQAKLQLGRRAEAVNDARQILILAVSSGDMALLVPRLVELFGPAELEQVCDAMKQAGSFQIAGYLGSFYLAAQGQDYEKALTAMKQVLARAKPEQESYWHYQLERAKLLTTAYDQTESPHYRDQAISDYQSLLTKWPTNSSVMNNLAYLLAESQDRIDEALSYAQKAWAAAPNNPVILDTYGYVLLKDGQYKQAVELLSASRQQYEQRQMQVPAQVFEHLGMAWEGLGEADKARRAFEQALTVEPSALTTRAQTRIRSAIGRLVP